MHYSVLVVFSHEDEQVTESAVECVIHEAEGIHWDWFQIGGRWTGLFDGYDPEKDELNLEPNGKAKWPTQWARHPGDIQPLSDLTQDQYGKFHSVAVEGYGWFSGHRYEPWHTGDKFPKMDLPPIEWLKKNGKVAVVVDCHN